MHDLSLTEENYLKAIYNISVDKGEKEVSVNEIADRLKTKPATVTDMLKRLSEKSLIHYEKYRKPRLSEKGIKKALTVVRNHRLWEVFLHTTLHFSWDEVHEIAEELEHINSPKLTERLDAFLGYPKFDPHGDPIPQPNGEVTPASETPLSQYKAGDKVQIVAVKESEPEFLHYLDCLGINIHTGLRVMEVISFDKSYILQVGEAGHAQISLKVAQNILVIPS